MRGKLAKQLRKVTGFHPYPDRQYRMVNEVTRFGINRIGLPCHVNVGSFVATGVREAYQKLKADVLRVKRIPGFGGAHA